MKPFLDALMFLGRSTGQERFQHSDADSLHCVMEKYRIGKALVCSYASRDLEPAYGNGQLFELAEKHSDLIPCPAVVPNSGLEVGDEREYVRKLVDDGARCAALFPKTFGTTLDEAVIGGLCSALEECRLPLALFETEIATAAPLAKTHPQLPLIVHAPNYRNRAVIPFLRDIPNLHVSLAPNFCPYRGLEVLASSCGADKLLFATGYPDAEPGATVSYLMYSDLTERDREKIASGNLERILNDIQIEKPAPVGERALQWAPPKDVSAHVWKRAPVPWSGIVDMHAHYGKFSRFPIWGGKAEDMIEEMDRVGIEKTIVSHQAVMATNPAYGNNEVLAAMRKYPDRFQGYAICYPASEELGIGEIRRAIDAGMCGIKLHVGAGFSYTSPGYEPVWEYADENGIPVLIHTWADIEKVEPILQRYERMPILAAHSGAGNAETYAAFAKRYPNLYLDLCLSHARYGIIEYFVEEVGAERITWGSDAPWMPFSQQLGRVLFAEISEPDKQCILVENPKRVFGDRL